VTAEVWRRGGFACALAVVLATGDLARGEDADPPAGHAGHEHGGEHLMVGVLGPYPATRESSGTSWQPDSSPHHAEHVPLGDWTVGAHAMIQAVLDHQGGDRGEDDAHANSMFMAMGQRAVGDGRLGLRAMMSLEPLTNGRNGYPLLLQTGETANGRTPLVDRQHPHDLFMELAAMYGLRTSDHGSVFAYVGYPGEPALGPPAFPHRISAMENPEAPIAHHWLDSTHISFGVLTLGATWYDLKFEGSVFTGREPDENRYDFEDPKLDSLAGRVAWNPSANWSLQTSAGHLQSPEQLHPGIDTDRYTASVIYGRAFADEQWQTMLAWGVNVHRSNRRIGSSSSIEEPEPEHALNAVLLESSVTFARRHTLFGRGEGLQVDELFLAPDPREGEKFTVGKLELGYLYDLFSADVASFGVGILGSVLILPEAALRASYGDAPLSGMLFARLRVG
jgi:hypothetical protein